MTDDFSAHDTIEEADWLREHAAAHNSGHTPRMRLVPVSASLLAVVAAIATLLANQRATNALEAKNEAILLRTEASDTYNFFESRSIKQHIYEAISDANPSLPKAIRIKLTTVAAHESKEKKPILEKARHLEDEAVASSKNAEHLMRVHEILETSVTLFEVAVAIVSISALTSSTFLIVFGALAAGAGIAILTHGLTLR
jgi:Domain of unknown function (DUF4337)